MLKRFFESWKPDGESEEIDEEEELLTEEVNPSEIVSAESESPAESSSPPDSETMESFMKPPPSLSFEGNVKENWRQWKRKFEVYMKATGLDKKEEERQVAVLLNVIGEDGLNKFDTFNLSEENQKKIKEVIEAFENYCTPKANESVDRHVFFMRVQQPTESFSEFLTDLKKLSQTCGFGTLRDSLIKDRIISGIRDSQVKNRLLREENLTLEKCCDICKAAELAKLQLKVMDDETKVHAVNSGNSKKTRKKKSTSQDKSANFQNQSTKQPHRSANEGDSQRLCSRCGQQHPPKQCPAYGKICNKCKKSNHFARSCKSKIVNVVDQDVDDDSFYIHSIDSKSENRDMCEKIRIANKYSVTVKYDTGAHCNVISFETLKAIGENVNNLMKTNTRLSAYGGSQIKVLGKCQLACKFPKKNEEIIEFIVVSKETNTPTIIGLPTLTSLRLIQKIEMIQAKELKTVNTVKTNVNSLVDKYKSVFTGTGTIKGYEYDIKLVENAEPKVMHARNVPMALLDPLKKELDRMEKMGVIEKIDEPTDWVNEMVIVKKSDGNLRICIDPLHLNKVIKREHFKIPTFEQISSRMTKAKFFTTLDADRAFWQIKLSKKSTKLVTFSTPFGRYIYHVMPAGLKPAPEFFQKCFYGIFGDLEGVEIYIDDMVVWGETQEEHDMRLEKVLKRAQERNVKFKLEKCQISLDSVKYVGHVLTAKGIKPDPEKIRAITEMRSPTSRSELETFLGMITYVSKFIPNMSNATALLRNLCKKNVVWNWDANAEKSFVELKKLLVNYPVLQYYDVNKPVVLSVDASQCGLGAVLLQEGLPVAYASKALTETEQKYAQIEKEALAIAYACIKFHDYIFDKKVLVESDHKPLEAIFKKPLCDTPARLQRIRLRIQRYNIEVNYKPGKELLLADALSRAYVKDNVLDMEKEIKAQVCLVTESFPISLEKKKEFQKVIETDDEMKCLKKFIMNGWPTNKRLIPEHVKSYYSFKEDLCIMDGLIFKVNRLVIPKAFRKEMLKKLHYTHLGIEKCKNRAREVMYWPLMNNEIHNEVQNCNSCIKYQKEQRKEPMISHEIPDGPWQTLGLDLFHYENAEWLLVVDYFSKYVEVAKLENMYGSTIVMHLKTIFARFGIPEKVVSDNGTHFVNVHCKEFAKNWGFEWVTSSPNYPQSNGMAERHIQTMKNMFKKIDDSGRDINIALLEYRNTPLCTEIHSPNEIMFRRKTRGLLPHIVTQYNADYYKKVKGSLFKKQQVQKDYYNRNARPLQDLKVQTNVYVRKEKDKPLIQAKVTKKCERPRSFEIELDSGSKIERNRRHLYNAPKIENVPNDMMMSESENENDCMIKNERTELTNTDQNENQVYVQDQPRNTVVTRSGRIVKPNSRYADYVT